MRDKLYIKSRLVDVDVTPVSQDPESLAIHQAKQKILYWIYNRGDIRPEEEIRIQLRNFEEELIGFDFANVKGFPVKLVKTKIKEIKNILDD